MTKCYGFGEAKLARLMKPCQNTQDSLHLNAILLDVPGCHSEADLGCFERGVMRPKRARFPSGLSAGERGRVPSEIFRAGENERPREKHGGSALTKPKWRKSLPMTELLLFMYVPVFTPFS